MGEKLEEQEKDEEKQSMVKNEKEIENDDNGVKSEGEEKDDKDTLKKDIQSEEEASDEENETPEEEEILPPPKVELKELHSIPDFAAVCNFFNKFQLISSMQPMNFGKLETLLTTYEKNKAPVELIELHVFLLRRAKYQHTTIDNWERYLTKFLYTNPCSEEAATHIERYGGYAYIPVVDKVQILKVLCETQIDTNVRLRDAILNTFRHVDLRLTPVGTDRYGLSYWYQQDNECNLRIYTEEPEDHCGSTWTLVAKTHDELKTLIENLEKDDLGYNKKLDPLEKQKEADIQKGKIPVGHTDKKGTYFDTYIDTEQINELKEAVLKVKTEKMNRRMGRPPKVRKFVESEEEEEEKKEVEAEAADEPENEEEPEIPEDLLEERRPRRGASIRAASNLKKVLGSGATPKRTPKKVVEKKASKSESDASENEDEDDEENEDEDTEESDNDQEDSGDEFRPKSEKKKVKKRRGRKARKPVDFDEDDEESNDEEEVKERKVATGDNACGKCKKSTDWEVLLLCDCCDDAWHTYCLKPVLWYVPDGDWYCPKCKHGRLIERLKAAEIRFDADLKQKAIEDKKKQAAAERLRREMEYIGVSLNNIIQTQLFVPQPVASSSESDDDGTQRKCKRKAVKKMTNWNKPKPQHTAPVFVGGRRSCRSRTKVDYKGSQFDQMIEEAVDNIDGAPPREVKPVREPELDENGEPKPKVGRGRKKARLNDLDAVVDSDGSNNYEEEQDDESASEEEDDEAEIDSGSDFEDELPKTSKHRSRRSYVRKGGSGKGRGRRKRSWSGSSTGEEEDDWIASDSDDGYRKSRKRKIKYESDVEEEEDVEKSTTGRPLRKAVKASDGERRKIVISDSEDDNEPAAKKRSKQRGSDDEFEVENDDNEEEEEEEEEEDEGDGDEDDDEEEDDDTEGDSNESAPQKDVKRMAGAPPSQQLPVRPIKPQISAKRPRIRPETVKAKTPESDTEDAEEEKKPERKRSIHQDIPITLPPSLFSQTTLPGNFDQMVPNPYLLPPPVTTTTDPAHLPVPNPYANVNTKDEAKPSGAQYLAL